MALVCSGPPLAEAVSLSELKEMLRLDPADTGQDGVLAVLNVAARAWCETISKRKFVQQTWTLLMDYFPGYIDTKLSGTNVSSPFVSGSNAVLVGIRYAMVLPYPPCQAVNYFRYQDERGSTSDLTAGQNYIQDLLSQPARLMPNFGQMWPVARVVANAVEVNYTCGFASPMAVQTTAGDKELTGPTFSQQNVGQPISIPGAGVNGGCLNTILVAVDDESGVGTVREAPQTTLEDPATGLLVNYGSPGHWELCRSAVKFLVNSWFVQRMPSFDAQTRDCVAAILSPAMDQRI